MRILPLLVGLFIALWADGASAQAGYTTYCWVSVPQIYTQGLYKPVLCDNSGRLLVTPGTDPWLDGGTTTASPPSLSAGVTSSLYLNLSGELMTAAYQAGTWLIASTITPTVTAPTNASVVIGTGNTFQQALVSNTSRLALTVANNNATDDCWLYFGTAGSATKATSILIPAKATYLRNSAVIPSSAVQVTCATTSDTLYVDSQ